MKLQTEKIKRRNLKRAKKVDRRIRELNRMKKRELDKALELANSTTEALTGREVLMLSPLQGGKSPPKRTKWWVISLWILILLAVGQIGVTLWSWLV